MSATIEWLTRPATLLALVPFIKLGLDWVFRRIFKTSVLDALTAAASDKRDWVREAVKEEGTREDLAVFVNNWASLEKVYQAVAFAALSLIVWNVFHWEQRSLRLISLLLLALTIVVTLYVAIRASQRKIEMASINSTRRVNLYAHSLDFLVLVFELIAKQFEQHP